MLLYYVLQHTTIPHTPEQKRTTAHAYNTHFTERSGNISLPTRTVEDYAVAVRVQPTEASEEDEHGGVDPMVGQRVLQGGCAAGHVSKNDILESVRGDAVAVPEKEREHTTFVFVSVHRASHTHGVLLHTY
jgi:hypothetical protein